MYIAHKHHGNHLILERIADEIRLLGLFPEKLWPSEDLESGGLTAIRLGTVRRSASGTENCEPICCQLSLVSVFEDYRSLGKLTVLILKDPNTGLLAEVNYLFCSVSPTIKIWLRMRNDGSCPVLVEAVYASVLYNLAVGGLRPRRCRTYIHLWSSNRGGDGQWQALALNELGHPSYCISQRYTGGGAGLNRITMGMLEDVETRTTWYWQVEPSRTCYWEFGEDDRGMLYVTAGEIGGLGANLPRNLAPRRRWAAGGISSAGEALSAPVFRAERAAGGGNSIFPSTAGGRTALLRAALDAGFSVDAAAVFFVISL